MSPPSIREALPAETEQIVQTHLASFDGFFLSTLGPRFLKLFYDGMIQADSGVLLVAIDDGLVVGFVGGATEQVGFYRTLFRTRAARFVLASVGAAFRRPHSIPRLLRARQRASGHSDALSDACLMTLGVRPGAEGNGVGQSLVKAFKSNIAAAGQTSYCLTTDAVGNERTNNFYQTLGLELVRVVVTPEGRRLNEYRNSW